MADLFNRFTEAALEVLTGAQEEAIGLNHELISSGHLLVGLAQVERGNAAKVLANLGVTSSTAREALLKTNARGDRPVSGEIGLTDQAKIVIEHTVAEFKRLGAAQIGTEHLLLGITRSDSGTLAGMFESLCIGPNEIRREVGRIMLEDEQQRGDPARIIDGKAIAAEVRAEVAERAKALLAKGVTPGLALVLVGDNPSSLSYVRSKGTTAEEAGLYSDFVHLPESTPEADVIAKVQALNADEKIHGILVQLPLPEGMSENKVIASIDPAKDADGVTATSLGKLMRGEPGPWPATPAGIVELLHRSGYPPAGKHVVVCGRSNIVGKPVANILMQKNEKANATVTLCHTGTADLGAMTRQADILIAAMGVAGAITADMVKPGAVVIDVGNNWIEDASRKSGRRLVGDVDYDAVREVASAITPVPGGVGPMTIAMLLSNTVDLAEGRSASG